MGQVHLVGVHGENLRLGVAALDLQGEQHFLRFAAEAAVAAIQKEIAGELHGDGAGAFGFAALEDVAIGGAGDAREVDAPVIFEVLVFDGGDGVVENFGDLLPGHQNAALQREAADKLAVVGVNLGDHVGAIGFERANFRQVAFVDEEQPGGGAERDGAEQQKGERDAVNQFPAAQSQGDRGKREHRRKILAQNARRDVNRWEKSFHRKRASGKCNSVRRRRRGRGCGHRGGLRA